MERLRLATVWPGGCSGCHMSFLDLDEWLIDLAKMADIVFTPFADVKIFPECVAVTLVEGAVANEDHFHFVQLVRACSRVLVALGYARLIEMLTVVERIEQMVNDADLQSTRLRADTGVNQLEGIGCSEAPRGTLFHHCQVNADGLIQRVNPLIATGQNNLAMSRAVLQIARHYIKGPRVPEGILNRLEAGIRAFDPCLSCSTHAAGQMPLHVQLFDAEGQLLVEVPWLTSSLSVTATNIAVTTASTRASPNSSPKGIIPACGWSHASSSCPSWPPTSPRPGW